MIPSAAERELFQVLYDMLNKADQLDGILKNYQNFWSSVMPMDYASQLLLELSENLLNCASFIDEAAASTLKKLDQKSDQQ